MRQVFDLAQGGVHIRQHEGHGVVFLRAKWFDISEDSIDAVMAAALIVNAMHHDAAHIAQCFTNFAFAAGIRDQKTAFIAVDGIGPVAKFNPAFEEFQQHRCDGNVV